MANLDRYTQTVMACRFCPMCRHVCTVANVLQQESTSPRGWGLTLYALSTGLVRPDDAQVAERLFQCAGCELCFGDCVSDFRPARAIRAARADLVQAGNVPAPIARIASDVRAYGNPYGSPLAASSAWRKDLDLSAKGDILFFAGCTVAYRQPEIGRAVAKIAQAAQVHLAVWDEEPCCGAPLYTTGHWSDFRELARSNLDRIARGHYRAVLFACPSCQRTFSQVCREEFDLPWVSGVEILHTSQWVERLLESGSLHLDDTIPGGVFTYHDPCTLGRAGLGVYESPRQVIHRLGVTFAEMEFNREMARCCGSSLLHDAYPRIAQGAVSNTLQEARRTQAGTLITACPSCANAFAAAAGPAGPQVLDLVQAVAARLA